MICLGPIRGVTSSWQLVEEKKIFAIEVNGVQGQKRYIEVDISKLPPIKVPLKKDSGIELCLNDLSIYGEFFGVEYKASDNKSPNSISVASFNSTCPSGTKTVDLKKVRIIHNFKSRSNITKNGIKLKHSDITLSIKFSIYYLIVNDEPVGNISQIRQIFICSGDFFAPGLSEEEAKALSKQLYPDKLGIEYSLYRVGLRYRPFFDSKMIKANGYGLYTSWEPKIPAEEEVERQRELLLKEVERIQQTFTDNEFEEVESSCHETPDNVIYLTLRDERIKKRAA